jgi:hypothetical protein
VHHSRYRDTTISSSGHSGPPSRRRHLPLHLPALQVQFPRHQRSIERGWPTTEDGAPQKDNSRDVQLHRDSLMPRFKPHEPRNPHNGLLALAHASLSESSVSAEHIRLGFTWRPPLVKQDLMIAQEPRNSAKRKQTLMVNRGRGDPAETKRCR